MYFSFIFSSKKRFWFIQSLVHMNHFTNLPFPRICLYSYCIIALLCKKIPSTHRILVTQKKNKFPHGITAVIRVSVSFS